MCFHCCAKKTAIVGVGQYFYAEKTAFFNCGIFSIGDDDYHEQVGKGSHVQTREANYGYSLSSRTGVG